MSDYFTSSVMKKNVIEIWEVIICIKIHVLSLSKGHSFHQFLQKASDCQQFVWYVKKFFQLLTDIYYKQAAKCIKKNKYDISFDDLNICTHLSFLTWTPFIANRRYAVTCLFIQSQVPVRVQIVSTL